MTSIRVRRDEAAQLTKILRARRTESTTIVLEAGDYGIDLCAIIGPVTLVGEAGARQTRIRPNRGEDLLKVTRSGTVLAVKGITFEDGESPAGGAIDASGETMVILEDCVFRNNKAPQLKGGAIHAASSVQLTVKRCLFEGNSSESGGAVAVAGGARGSIQACLFHRNAAALGGAVIVEAHAQATITSCSFLRDAASHEAGGDELFVSGTLSTKPSVKVVNALFVAKHPIVNNPNRPGDLSISHSVVPPTALDGVKHRDLGGILEVEADLVEQQEGLMALRPGSPGSGTADVEAIAEAATDLLGRPLVSDGCADPGALAAG